MIKPLIAFLALSALLFTMNSSGNRMVHSHEDKDTGVAVPGETISSHNEQEILYNPENFCGEAEDFSSPCNRPTFISGKLMNNLYVIL